MAIPEHLVSELLDAADSLMANLMDAGEHKPDLYDDEANEYPTDEDGQPWYPDCLRLKNAIEAVTLAAMATDKQPA